MANDRPTTNTDKALHSVERSNKVISISTVVALVLIVAMLGVALFQLNAVTKRQQDEAARATERNSQLLGSIADYLECIAKTNPVTRTPQEVDACLNILRQGGDVSSFLDHPTSRPKVVGLMTR